MNPPLTSPDYQRGYDDASKAARLIAEALEHELETIKMQLKVVRELNAAFRKIAEGMFPPGMLADDDEDDGPHMTGEEIGRELDRLARETNDD